MDAAVQPEQRAYQRDPAVHRHSSPARVAVHDGFLHVCHRHHLDLVHAGLQHDYLPGRAAGSIRRAARSGKNRRRPHLADDPQYFVAAR
ncbi:hypothetical protein D3C76_1522660 [compost metagenome]